MKLPTADEQAHDAHEWERLRADVAALLKRRPRPDDRRFEGLMPAPEDKPARA